MALTPPAWMPRERARGSDAVARSNDPTPGQLALPIFDGATAAPAPPARVLYEPTDADLPTVWIDRAVLAASTSVAARTVPTSLLGDGISYEGMWLKITADGLEIYLSSSRGGGNDIWMSTRSSRADAWLPPTLVTELSSGSGDFQAQPSPSKLRLVLYRSSGDRDVYESTRVAVDQPWTSPTVLSSLSSPDGDRSPCLYGSELEIVFSSDRDSGTFDVQDLFRATRPAVGDEFGAAVPLSTVNSPADDDDPWVSPDGRVLYFSSDRGGDTEIYEARL